MTRQGTTEGAGAPGSSQEAFGRLSGHLGDLGITRLADLTGLDRIGIPVVQAVRPLGLCNAVTQGKGEDLHAAAVSAIMEAAEQHFAERVEAFAPILASADALGIEAERWSAHLIPGVGGAWSRRDTAWVPAQDAISGRRGLVPFELVHCAYSEPALPTDGLFTGSTTGLACAFDEERALRHGLLECVERDAIARAERTHGFLHRHRIRPDSIEDGRIAGLLERIAAAGCVAAIWQAPAVGDMPVAWCQIVEDGSRTTIAPFPADGFAADPDPAQAVLRALLEAAQARLAAISGARDDITRAAYPDPVDWDAIDRYRAFLRDGPRPLAFDAWAARQDSGSDPVGPLLERMAGAGIEAAWSVRLPNDTVPEIVAVRVLVPQLQPLQDA